jgi:hypothetical protein
LPQGFEIINFIEMAAYWGLGKQECEVSLKGKTDQVERIVF